MVQSKAELCGHVQHRIDLNTSIATGSTTKDFIVWHRCLPSNLRVSTTSHHPALFRQPECNQASAQFRVPLTDETHASTYIVYHFQLAPSVRTRESGMSLDINRREKRSKARIYIDIPDHPTFDQLADLFTKALSPFDHFSLLRIFDRAASLACSHSGWLIFFFLFKWFVVSNTRAC